MFVGGYWSKREESRESAATRIADFLTNLSSYGTEFSNWYRQGKSRATRLKSPLSLQGPSIAAELEQNFSDFDRKPIPDLGFSFSAWNGLTASFMATLGGWSPYVRNSVILRFGGGVDLGENSYRAILEMLVRTFDPEHGVVTSSKYLDKVGVANPWEAGMFTYVRGGLVEQRPFDNK